MRLAAGLMCLSLLGQTVPRLAGDLAFTLLDGGAPVRLADYKGKLVLLYLFSPD